jgi:serine/threonine protein phosphatase 1
MSGRQFVIGDIHGCARELDVLLEALPLARGDTLAFVGDYIDRGPESAAVIERMIELGTRTDITTVFLKGNHEDMCLDYLGRRGHWGEAWGPNGGGATLRSYGLDARAPGAEAAAAMPAAHLDFMEALRPWHIAGTHLLVHAGIRPGRPLEAQDEEDLFWIRDEFIGARHTLPYTVVFGHTPRRNVLVDLPYKVGIDTGCVYGGRLTALELGERLVFQVPYGGEKVKESRVR